MAGEANRADQTPLIEHQIRELGEQVRELNRLMRPISQTLERVDGLRLVATDHEKRLREVEKYQPGLRETRTWVVAWAAALVTALASYSINNMLTRPIVMAKPPSGVIYGDPDQQKGDGK